MNRNELLHRMAEGETVTIHDVDTCIKEEKELLIEKAVRFLKEDLHECRGKLDEPVIDSRGYWSVDTLIKAFRQALK